VKIGLAVPDARVELVDVLAPLVEVAYGTSS
jgi:hypothetical protein